MKKPSGNYYRGSTQEWLPIETVSGGLIRLKDGRYIKLLEILPVNFYLKSDIEQQNIIYYFASYLKIAPDNMQIRVVTERANIEDYLARHEHYAKSESNEQTTAMIYDEIDFVKRLSENVAIKKRFFIAFEYSPKVLANQNLRFADIQRLLSDEAYKAQRYLSQCELGVIDICDNGQLIDLLYGFINKYTSKYITPGNFADGMFAEIHMQDGGEADV
ncbi:MAG: hypothetical protein IJF67_13975 [Clostridia bacterium]|nr:hypothetical protein [Clostridia bacterium]